MKNWIKSLNFTMLTGFATLSHALIFGFDFSKVAMFFVIGILFLAQEYFKLRQSVVTENEFRKIIIKEMETLKLKMEALSLGKLTQNQNRNGRL